jgi:hypothetical protein
MPTLKLGTTTAITESSGTLTYAQPTGILQLEHSSMAGTQSSSSTNFITVTDGSNPLIVNITPLFVTSKILITVSMYGSFGVPASVTTYSQLLRDSTLIHNFGAVVSSTDAGFVTTNNTTYLDAPATTTQVTYTVQTKGDGAGWGINRRQSSAQNIADSSITAMEIAVGSL